MRQTASLWISLFFLTLTAIESAAFSVPVVTDVTPRSFCVAWYSGEDSAPSLTVFLDEDGTEELTGAAVTVQPTMADDGAAGALAAAEGVLKVRAEDLSPDTTYFFQTVTVLNETDETVLFPSTPPFPSVRTQMEVVRHEGSAPFANDLCAVEVYVSGVFTGDDCGLAVALFEGSAHPISSFVGDSVYGGWALLDLNNLFSAVTGSNLSLKGGETVTLYFLTEGGVSDGTVYRVFSPNGLSAPQSDLPMFGDFFGAYGVDMSDAVAGLQIMTGQDIDIKALEGISPSPSRGLGEIVFVLQKLAGESRP